MYRGKASERGVDVVSTAHELLHIDNLCLYEHRMFGCFHYHTPILPLYEQVAIMNDLTKNDEAEMAQQGERGLDSSLHSFKACWPSLDLG